MFQEEKCPYCNDGNYEIIDYNEDGTDSGFMREWSCKCQNCHKNFEITYYYTLAQVLVEKGE